VASLAYRVTVSPMAGYYFIKTTNSFLSGEIGPSLVDEKYFDQSASTYWGARLGERGEHKFAGGAKVWESVEYIPKVDDFNNYLVNAEAGVSAPISKSLSLTLVMDDTYKSVPATGKEKNDFKLLAGLSYHF
jgi:putative salt-induced outer membrane protein YdiY